MRSGRHFAGRVQSNTACQQSLWWIMSHCANYRPYFYCSSLKKLGDRCEASKVIPHRCHNIVLSVKSLFSFSYNTTLRTVSENNWKPLRSAHIRLACGLLSQIQRHHSFGFAFVPHFLAARIVEIARNDWTWYGTGRQENTMRIDTEGDGKMQLDFKQDDVRTLVPTDEATCRRWYFRKHKYWHPVCVPGSSNTACNPDGPLSSTHLLHSLKTL